MNKRQIKKQIKKQFIERYKLNNYTITDTYIGVIAKYTSKKYTQYFYKDMYKECLQEKRVITFFI